VVAHIWDTSGGTPPFGGRTFRFAIGTPSGPSSNSWVVTTPSSGNVYLKCRDNFSEVKVSLHKSGKWRFAQTEDAASARPDLVRPGQDRAITKWDPPEGWGHKPVVAFQVRVPRAGLYLGPAARTGWKRKVVFVEPHRDPRLVTVVHVSIAPLGMRFDYGELEGGNLADLNLDDRFHVLIDVTFEDIATTTNLEALRDYVIASPDAAKVVRDFPDPVVLTHGLNAHGARFLMALPLKPLLEAAGSRDSV
jgi:hypothetical protein